MKTFTTIKEVAELADTYGISYTKLAEAAGISKQTFSTKLRTNSLLMPRQAKNLDIFFQELHERLGKIFDKTKEKEETELQKLVRAFCNQASQLEEA